MRVPEGMVGYCKPPERWRVPEVREGMGRYNRVGEGTTGYRRVWDGTRRYWRVGVGSKGYRRLPEGCFVMIICFMQWYFYIFVLLIYIDINL